MPGPASGLQQFRAMRARPLGDREGGETGQTLDVAGLHRYAVEFAPRDASELLP